MVEDQNHPLYLQDRDLTNRLISKETPNNNDLVDLARLFNRYEDFPGATDLKLDLEKILKLWKFNRDELNVKTRTIWNEGFRPTISSEEEVGSGFDTSDKGSN